MGIYITVYDATPVEEKSHGLEHFFRMKTTEILYEDFTKMDLVDIRTEFEKRNTLTKMYIERFEPGEKAVLYYFYFLHKTNKIFMVKIHQKGRHM